MNVKQYILDKVVAGIYAQGGPSYNTELQACMYRSGDCKYAAGHLISDNHYSPTLEHRPSSSHNVSSAIFNSLNEELATTIDGDEYENNIIPFVRQLQIAHDNAALPGKRFFESFERNLNGILDRELQNGLILNIPKAA